MIDLERNSKKQLIDAKGKRTRESSIYKPNQKDNFRISRGKFSDFLSCPRCFYLDRVRGLKPPGTPGWTLNETTDLLLKTEFDECREKQIPHRLFSKFGLNHVVPYKHKDIEKWRNSLNAGLQVQYKNSNIILTGGIDDIWIDLNTQELIVVDYKSQAKTGYVEQTDYLEDPYHHGYKVQMDFYAYLLIQMGYQVKETSYFLVCNANRTKDGFHGQMEFDEYLIPYEWNIKWIDHKVDEMISLINQEQIPLPNKSCNNCAYSNQYAIALGNIGKREINNFQNHKINTQLNKDEKNISLEKFGETTNLENCVSVISPVLINCSYLKEEHFGVIIHRSNDIYTVVTSYDIWGGDEYYDDISEDWTIEITTLIDNKKHKFDVKQNLHSCEVLSQIYAQYPQLSKVQFKSNENYISEMEDYLNIKSHLHNSLADCYKKIFLLNEKNELSKSIFNNLVTNKIYKFENNQLLRIIQNWISWAVLIRDLDNKIVNFGFILNSENEDFSILTDYSTFKGANFDEFGFGINIQTFTKPNFYKLKCIEHHQAEGASYPGFAIWSNFLKKNDIKHSDLRNKFLYSCVLINEIGFGIIIYSNKNEHFVLTSLELLQKSITFKKLSDQVPMVQTLMDGLKYSVSMDSLLEGIRTSVHPDFAIVKFNSDFYYPALGFNE